MGLAEEIKERGFWRILIRPESFEAERIAYRSLLPIMRECRVSIRGWDFPHFEKDVRRMDDHLSGETDWECHRETWRFYQSGLFAFLGCISNDWLERHRFVARQQADSLRKALSLGDVLFRNMEIFEFASRLSRMDMLVGPLVVDTTMGNLQKRQLILEQPNRSLFNVYEADLPDWQRIHTYSPGELADPKSLAVEETYELAQRFGLDAGKKLVSDIADELLGS